MKFWFATGGAGFCISKALAIRMAPVAGGGKLIGIGDKIRFPDDVTVGFVIGMCCLPNKDYFPSKGNDYYNTY